MSQRSHGRRQFIARGLRKIYQSYPATTGESSGVFLWLRQLREAMRLTVVAPRTVVALDALDLGPNNPNTLLVRPPGEWNQDEIRGQGQSYQISLNGQLVTNFTFAAGGDAQHPERALHRTPDAYR